MATASCPSATRCLLSAMFVERDVCERDVSGPDSEAVTKLYGDR